MDVLLHIEIFESFLKDNIFREDTDLLIYNIFNNPDTKIVFNNQIKNYLLEKYGDNPKRKLFIESEFTKLVTKNRVVRQITESSLLDWNDNFIELNTNYKGKSLFKIAKTRNTKIDKITDLIVLKEAQKPNIHWIKTYLVAYSTITVRYFDFKIQSEVLSFFNNIFSTAEIKHLIILDRYIIENINKHSNFDSLKGKKIPTDIYFLETQTSNVNTVRAKKIVIENIFGALSSFVCFHITKDSSKIHERKLIFEDFLVEADEDFSKICHGIETWKISISYSPQMVGIIKNKLNAKGYFTKII